MKQEMNSEIYALKYLLKESEKEIAKLKKENSELRDLAYESRKCVNCGCTVWK